MTKKGAQSVYIWLTTAWPLVIKPGAPDDWKRAKMRELYDTFAAYDDAEVLKAFQKWTELNDKFPTTKNIITELEFARAQGVRVIPQGVYSMPVIHDDGTEALVWYGGKAAFTWNEFKAVPRNVDHLDPDEWERRYLKRRDAVLRRLYG